MNPSRTRLLVIGAVLGIVVGASGMFILKESDSIASPQQPPIASVDSGSAGDGQVHPDEESLEMQRVTAIGFSNAEEALPGVLGKSPFPVRLPGFLPDDVALERFNLMTFDEAAATMDLYYTVADTSVIPRPAVHIWQTNGEYDAGREPLQQSVDEGQFEIDGNVWSYWLLAYPQPDGQVSELYNAEITLPDGISVTVDIRAGYDPTSEERASSLEDLERVIASLQLAE